MHYKDPCLSHHHHHHHPCHPSQISHYHRLKNILNYYLNAHPEREFRNLRTQISAEEDDHEDCPDFRLAIL